MIVEGSLIATSMADSALISAVSRPEAATPVRVSSVVALKAPAINAAINKSDSNTASKADPARLLPRPELDSQ